LVTITRDFYTGEFVVRRASADKTVMVAKPTKQEAETAAFQMGYRIVKSGKGTRELSGAPE
jgi:hypothetical protein